MLTMLSNTILEVTAALHHTLGSAGVVFLLTLTLPIAAMFGIHLVWETTKAAIDPAALTAAGAAAARKARDAVAKDHTERMNAKSARRWGDAASTSTSTSTSAAAAPSSDDDASADVRRSPRRRSRAGNSAAGDGASGRAGAAKVTGAGARPSFEHPRVVAMTGSEGMVGHGTVDTLMKGDTCERIVCMDIVDKPADFAPRAEEALRDYGCTMEYVKCDISDKDGMVDPKGNVQVRLLEGQKTCDGGVMGEVMGGKRRG